MLPFQGVPCLHNCCHSINRAHSPVCHIPELEGTVEQPDIAFAAPLRWKELSFADAHTQATRALLDRLKDNASVIVLISGKEHLCLSCPTTPQTQLPALACISVACLKEAG